MLCCAGLCELALRCALICATWKFKATEQLLIFGCKFCGIFLGGGWGGSFEISDVSNRTRNLALCHAALCAHCFGRLVTPRCVATLCGKV